MPDHPSPEWRTSTRSQGGDGNCVEVAVVPGRGAARPDARRATPCPFCCLAGV
ncbi:DUF397 domain-containing protein [Actinoallomurus iriomotensis]|uniref:DUF397 domain-containing protein n=1 Tax=Actinoallomurus iriomotensis TaxID=478107 RepID=UPI003D7FD883